MQIPVDSCICGYFMLSFNSLSKEKEEVNRSCCDFKGNK